MIRNKDFLTGPGHVFNPVPTNDEERLQAGNAMAASGNYPYGMSGCYCVGLNGGCGLKCYVYKEGNCGEPWQVFENVELTEEDKNNHYKLYGKEEHARG